MTEDAYTLDFFISYAQPDKAFAEELFDALSPRAKTFLATRSLSPGDLWPEKLQLAQQQSLATLVLVSCHSASAHFQREEILAAIQLIREGDHHVIPLYLDNSPPPAGLKSIHSIFCADRDVAKTALDLLQLLERLKGNSGAPIHVDVSAHANTSRNRNMPSGHSGPAIPADVHSNQQLLSQVGLELSRSGGAVITGPSGSGKTTTAYSFLCSESARAFRERWYLDCRQPDIPAIDHLDSNSLVVFDQVSAGHPCLTGAHKLANIRSCQALMIIVPDDEVAAKVALGILKLRAPECADAIHVSPLSLELWKAKLACFSNCHDSNWPERSWKLFEGKPRFLQWLLQLELGCRDSSSVERDTKTDSQMALISSWCDLHEGPLLEVIATLVSLPLIGMSLKAVAHVLNLEPEAATRAVERLGDEGIVVANRSLRDETDPLLMAHDLFRRLLVACPQYPELESSWRSRYKDWLDTVTIESPNEDSISAMARLDAWIAGMYDVFNAPRGEFLERLRKHCQQLETLKKQTAGSSARQRFARNAMPLNGNLLSHLKQKLEQRDERGEYVVGCQPLIGFYKAAALTFEPSIELARIVFAGALRDDAYVSFQSISNAAAIWYRNGSEVSKREGYKFITLWFEESAKRWDSKLYVDLDYAAAFGALRLLRPNEDAETFVEELLRLREEYCISGVELRTHMILLITLADLGSRDQLEAYLERYGNHGNSGFKIELRVTDTQEQLTLEPASFYVEQYVHTKYPGLRLGWWPPAINLIEVDTTGKQAQLEHWKGEVSTIAGLSRSADFSRFLERHIGSLGYGY